MIKISQKETFKTNKELLALLTMIVNSDNGSQQFSQILIKFGFIEELANDFSAESKSTLEKVTNICTKVFR